MRKMVTSFVLALLMTAFAATAFAANGGIALDQASNPKQDNTEVSCCVDGDHH
jgi:hypothetical protein